LQTVSGERLLVAPDRDRWK